VASDLVGKPFTFRMGARGTGPYCRGCPARPPDVDLGSVETTAALEDFTTAGPKLQLVCGPSSTLELRHVLVVEFRPTVHNVSRRTKRRRSPEESMRNYRVVGIAVDAESSFPTRIVDAVTAEAIARVGWRLEEEPWHPEMCGTDS
jgi:hypothetical protein